MGSYLILLLLNVIELFSNIELIDLEKRRE